ncbi:MAG: putative tellurite resistance protein B-like protein [Myxococcota bacterium]|jgi:uncharacterized tellurite resistance protein B-like protein
MALADLLLVPPEDRDLFVRWMVKLARADGALDPSEVAVLHELVAAWDLTVDEVIALHRSLRDGPDLGPDAPPGFIEPRSPFLLVRMLIQLAHEDGSYVGQERDAVLEVAARYRIPAERVAALEAWVRVDAEHQREGRGLLIP